MTRLQTAFPTTSTWAGEPQDIDSIFADDLALDAIFAVLESKRDLARLAGATASDEPSRPWVLCIDDDADFSAGLRRRLEAAGYDVVSASTGMEGFNLACTEPASAILLDYNMPSGQGDYILSRLKKNPVTADIPVLVITGNKSRDLQRRMLALGAARFFTKPLDFTELLGELGRHVKSLKCEVRI